METVFLNGRFLPEDQAMISPNDRGFLFGDSVYEVTRWYGGYFFDLPGHAERFRRSLNETRISWKEESRIEEISLELIERNGLGTECAIVYLQATRGVAPRNHAFPDPPVEPLSTDLPAGRVSTPWPVSGAWGYGSPLIPAGTDVI